MSGSSVKGALPTAPRWHSQCAGFLLALPLWVKSDCQVPGTSPRNSSVQRKRETPRMFLLEARLSPLESFPTPGDLPLPLLAGVGHVAFLTQYLANQRGLPWLVKTGQDPFLTGFRIPLLELHERVAPDMNEWHPCWQKSLWARLPTQGCGPISSQMWCCSVTSDSRWTPY